MTGLGSDQHYIIVLHAYGIRINYQLRIRSLLTSQWIKYTQGIALQYHDFQLPVGRQTSVSPPLTMQSSQQVLYVGEVLESLASWPALVSCYSQTLISVRYNSSSYTPMYYPQAHAMHLAHPSCKITCFRGFPLQNLGSDTRKPGHFNHVFSLYDENIYGSEDKPTQNKTIKQIIKKNEE